MRKVLEERFNQLDSSFQRILDLLEGEHRAVATLEKRNAELWKQNTDLLDRLMARDWDSYAIFKSGTLLQNSDLTGHGLPQDSDEANAGLILEIEE